jgi:hypothetical protein
MTELILQNPIDAVHERFARGGSVSHFLIVLGLLLAGMIALIAVNRWQKSREDEVAEDSPKKLYRDLLRELGVGVVRRDIMLRMARELRVDHPATLLMGPRVFRNHARKWLRNRDNASDDNAERELNGLCQDLFGEELKT